MEVSGTRSTAQSSILGFSIFSNHEPYPFGVPPFIKKNTSPHIILILPWSLCDGEMISGRISQAASTIHLHRTLNQIKSMGCMAGVVLNPGTPLSQIEYVLSEVGWYRMNLEKASIFR